MNKTWKNTFILREQGKGLYISNCRLPQNNEKKKKTSNVNCIFNMTRRYVTKTQYENRKRMEEWKMV